MSGTRVDPSVDPSWDRNFLTEALTQASYSKDPNTKVGAVIVDRARNAIVCVGFNRFPNGILEDTARLNDRDTKLKVIIHAEMAALMSAAKKGTAVNGLTLYLAATDDTKHIWGGPPCTRCTAHILESGITEVVSLPRKEGASNWHEDLTFAQGLIDEAGITYREVSITG